MNAEWFHVVVLVWVTICPAVCLLLFYRMSSRHYDVVISSIGIRLEKMESLIGQTATKAEEKEFPTNDPTPNLRRRGGIVQSLRPQDKSSRALAHEREQIAKTIDIADRRIETPDA